MSALAIAELRQTALQDVFGVAKQFVHIVARIEITDQRMISIVICVIRQLMKYASCTLTRTTMAFGASPTLAGMKTLATQIRASMSADAHQMKLPPFGVNNWKVAIAN